MIDFLCMGGTNAIYEADARANYALGAESAQVCELITGGLFAVGESGDFVLRRLYLPIQWESAVAMTITPMVDAKPLTGFQRTVNRSGAGRAEIMVPLSKRGGSLAVKIVTGPPTGHFSVDANAWALLHVGLVGKEETT